MSLSVFHAEPGGLFISQAEENNLRPKWFMQCTSTLVNVNVWFLIEIQKKKTPKINMKETLTEETILFKKNPELIQQKSKPQWGLFYWHNTDERTPYNMLYIIIGLTATKNHQTRWALHQSPIDGSLVQWNAISIGPKDEKWQDMTGLLQGGGSHFLSNTSLFFKNHGWFCCGVMALAVVSYFCSSLILDVSSRTWVW